MLVVAVESYYLTATLVQHDSLDNLNSAVHADLAAVRGPRGRCVRRGRQLAATGALLLRPLGVAIGGSVLIAEAFVYLYRSSVAGSNRTDDRQTALIEAILGLLIVFILARTKRRRVIAYGLCVPLSGLGFLAFLAAGFGQ